MSQPQPILLEQPALASGASLLSVQSMTDFISLTKPKVMVLLLISTACPMVLAADGRPVLLTLLLTVLGGALISGSASALNCVWDRDIDRLMKRTATRPLAAGRLTPLAAVIFSFIIGLLGLVLLAVFVNPLAATVALFGHLFYVLVYTMWLKRTTPQNIVIGGAAGAVPPVVGWVAVTGSIDLTAVLMFLLVFLWTPPHFWALALNKNDDYQRAGVPMLPVVAGERATHAQMIVYAVLLLPVSILMVISDPRLSWFSMVSMIALSVIFIIKNLQLKFVAENEPRQKEKKAWDVFGFSLIYLSLFFAVIVVDSVFI
jgi:protoheme IX farnesyltransferase